MNDQSHTIERKSIFHGMTLKLAQLGIFKIGMLAFGLAAGAYWHDFFGRGLPVLIVIAVASLAHIAYIYFQDQR